MSTTTSAVAKSPSASVKGVAAATRQMINVIVRRHRLTSTPASRPPVPSTSTKTTSRLGAPSSGSRATATMMQRLFPSLNLSPGGPLSALRDGTLFLHRLLSRQLDRVAAEQIRRRSVALAGHYSRLWGRDQLRQLLRRVARRFFYRWRNGAGNSAAALAPLLGLSFFTPSPEVVSHGWTGKRLPDDFLTNHKRDVEMAHQLAEETLTCKSCKRRHRVDDEVAGVAYCECKDRKASVYGQQTENIPWTPFLEKPDILVWRQEHPTKSGQYIYKMYGRFNDVTPNEFLQVQLDLTEFRLSWDANAAQCRVIEEEMDEKLNCFSQIYYWEVSWPRFFSNRDYVCNRRSQIFMEDNVAVIYSKATDHPAAPVNERNYRVTDYWSVLALKPSAGWTENGLEFCLTAFENPGVSLPASITTWVAMRGMPEFMQHLREACMDLRRFKEEKEQRRKDNESPFKTELPHALHGTEDDCEEEGKEDEHDPSKVGDGESNSRRRPRAKEVSQQQQQEDESGGGGGGGGGSPRTKKYVFVNVTM